VLQRAPPAATAPVAPARVSAAATPSATRRPGGACVVLASAATSVTCRVTGATTGPAARRSVTVATVPRATRSPDVVTARAAGTVSTASSVRHRRYCCTDACSSGPCLRGEGYGFNPRPFPRRSVEKKIFWQCVKARPAKCEHYCDARKCRLASIKCKKPLGRPELRPGPRWESLRRSPRLPS